MENRGKKQREDRGVVASPLQLTLKVIMIPNKEKGKKKKKKEYQKQSMDPYFFSLKRNQENVSKVHSHIIR